MAGAIHRAAGPGLAEECLPLDTLCPGQAVITSAHRLPNRFVIHCLGPIYGVNEPAADLSDRSAMLPRMNSMVTPRIVRVLTSSSGFRHALGRSFGNKEDSHLNQLLSFDDWHGRISASSVHPWTGYPSGPSARRATTDGPSLPIMLYGQTNLFKV